MGNLKMLDALRDWFTANKDKLTAAPINARLRRSELEDETLTPALYKASVDLQSETVLTSFTVWGTGEVSVIIMDNESGSELLMDEQRLQPEDLQVVLDHYYGQIVTNGPFVRYVLDRQRN